MNNKIGIVILGLALLVHTKTFAQEQSKENKDARQGATYANFRFGYESGSVKNFDYQIPSVSIGIESEWKNNHLGLSGHKFEWRKEQFNTSQVGQLLGFQLTRILPGSHKHFLMKAGGGLEWGIPSEQRDNSKFNYGPDGTITSYSHIYMQRNFWSPVGTNENAILQPVLEFKIKSPPIPLELGVRFQKINFNIDKYEIESGNYKHTRESVSSLNPSFFIQLQIKLY